MNFNELAQKLLCPPGNGVFTVNTAKERKDELHSKIYPNSLDVQNSWIENFKNINLAKVFLLGICSDTGGGILRGANWGPLFLRQKLWTDHKSLLSSSELFDLGDIRVIPHLLHDKYLNQETIDNCKKALYGDNKIDLPVSSLSMTEVLLKNAFKSIPNFKLFSIGGDHSVSYPLTKEYLIHKKSQGKKVAIIHFDAHTDLLIERLGIDICFGSWTTHILQYLQEPSLVHQIGIRSSGKPKSHWEKEFGVNQYWASEVKDKGIDAITKKIISDLKSKGVDELYVSFDIDAIDSQYASATGTPEPDGLQPHEAIICLELLKNEFPCTGADIVEISPFLQTTSKTEKEPDTTLEVASAIGQKLIQWMTKS